MPEVAFAGKSNVGKSYLINGLMKLKSLARTSGQPGKTQNINFYNINGERYLVDLPGYVYARVSQAEKEKWGKMIEKYILRMLVHKSLKHLRGIVLTIDSTASKQCQFFFSFHYIKFLNIFTVTRTCNERNTNV